MPLFFASRHRYKPHIGVRVRIRVRVKVRVKVRVMSFALDPSLTRTRSSTFSWADLPNGLGFLSRKD